MDASVQSVSQQAGGVPVFLEEERMAKKFSPRVLHCGISRVVALSIVLVGKSAGHLISGGLLVGS